MKKEDPARDLRTRRNKIPSGIFKQEKRSYQGSSTKKKEDLPGPSPEEEKIPLGIDSKKKEDLPGSSPEEQKILLWFFDSYEDGRPQRVFAGRRSIDGSSFEIEEDESPGSSPVWDLHSKRRQKTF